MKLKRNSEEIYRCCFYWAVGLRPNYVYGLVVKYSFKGFLGLFRVIMPGIMGLQVFTLVSSFFLTSLFAYFSERCAKTIKKLRTLLYVSDYWTLVLQRSNATQLSSRSRLLWLACFYCNILNIMYI